jgi:hypothetical protein
MSPLSLVAKKLRIPPPGECLVFFFEEKHATLSVFVVDERADILIHFSSKTDLNKLKSHLDVPKIKYLELASNRLQIALTKRRTIVMGTMLEYIASFIVGDLGYE